MTLTKRFQHRFTLSVYYAVVLVCAISSAAVGMAAYAQEGSSIEESDSATADESKLEETESAVTPDKIRLLLTKYCSECHRGDELEGDFDLAELDEGEKVGAAVNTDQLQRWAEVGEALLDDYMPPEDSPQPTDAEKSQIVDWIKVNAMPQKEVAVLRRMNRIEYENTIRDLFRLKRDAFANPNKILKISEYFNPSAKKMPRYVFAISHFAFPDLQRPELLEVSNPPTDLPAEHGFNNDVEALQFSPLLAEKYIYLSSEIVNSPTLPVIAAVWDRLFVFEIEKQDDGAAESEIAIDDFVDGARQRLAEFLPRAFRRPVSEPEVERFVQIFSESFLAEDAPAVVESVTADKKDVERSSRRRVAQLPRLDKSLHRTNQTRRLSKSLPNVPPVSEDGVRQVDVLKLQQRFTESMKETVSTVLISPDFLFLFQRPTNDSLSAEQQQSIVNASRLSYFLWASTPDGRLMELAQAGELCTEEQLQAEARRMLLDKKVKSLATDFGMQWLKVNRLSSSQPDPDKFPQFYSRRKQPMHIAMMIEQLLLFETVLVEDRSVLDFVHAEYAYLNRDLLYWYGYSPERYVGFTPNNNAPEDFFRVQFPKTHLRGGAITSGATAVLTSTSVRTSPVFRGAWVAETIFNRPPPPPPANVGALEDIPETQDGKEFSIRERLAIHRKDPNCASCHAKIDPLGFALEQFDPVGKIRQNYDNGDRIDSAGEYDGQPFSHAYSMKKMILSNKETFVRAFVEQILRYAVNRKLTLADQDDVDQITAKVMADDCRFHKIVEHVVASKTFAAQGE